MEKEVGSSQKAAGSAPAGVGTGVTDDASPDGLARFLVEIPTDLIDRLIHRDGGLGFHQRHDVRAILAALDALGIKPRFTRET